MSDHNNKQAHIITVTILALIACIGLNFKRVYQLNEDPAHGSETTVDVASEDEAGVLLNEADLASLANSKAQRNTELGKVTNATKARGKEVDVIFASDPAMGQKWDLNLTQTQEAWSKHRAFGSKDIKVCVIDTGVDVKHPDIKDNLWVNPGEMGRDVLGRDLARNGVDDDNDGCVDDVHGCNFVGSNNDLTDHHGHGTHIAGIIGAVGGNGIGISGVSPRVSLIIAKYYDPNSTVNNNLINTVRAIRYCILKKADVINYSGGGLEPSEKEREAIELARQNGIIFVAAAGNEQANSDFKKYYPADYGLDNIISVTAFDKDKNVLPTSNYGTSTVDIAAPGKNIYSTLPGGSYGYMTGTSQATAMVTGVAAILKSRFRDFDAARIIRHITMTGDLEEKLNGKTRNQKRLNAYRALAILDQGVTATGAVPKNTANMHSGQFSVSVQDFTPEATSKTANSPDGLVGIGRELQKILDKKSQRKSP